MENFDMWFAFAGKAFIALCALATATPSKTDDEIATKAQQVGSALNVVGFDLKSIFSLFSKKK